LRRHRFFSPGLAPERFEIMPTPPPPVTPTTPAPHALQPLPGFLSYLVPGLGQMYQGRVGKGLLFLVCIYTLFFYGIYLGSGTVEYEGKSYTVTSNVYLPDTTNERNNTFNLPHFFANLYNRPQFIGQFWVGVAAWPALIQYQRADRDDMEGHPLLGQFQRTPSEEALNAVIASGDKHMELGWVYTVIAGVLNIMVIYDACAGPAFLLTQEPSPQRAS